MQCCSPKVYARSRFSVTSGLSKMLLYVHATHLRNQKLLLIMIEETARLFFKAWANKRGSGSAVYMFNEVACYTSH